MITQSCVRLHICLTALLMALCCLMAVSPLQGKEEIEITPENALNRLALSIASKDTDALSTAYNDAAKLANESTQDGPEELTRPEKLAFKLKVLSLLASGIEPGEDEPFSMNVSAPGVRIAGMAPGEVEDPKVRKEYERRIAENKAKIEKHRRKELLKFLQESWIRNLLYFVTQYYGTGPVEVAEIKSVIHSTVGDATSRLDLEKLLTKGKHGAMFGDELAKRVTAAPEELLTGLAASLQTGNTDAANAMFNQLVALCGERTQDGPEKMTRREKLKYRFRILNIIGLNIDERPEQKFDINPAATVSSAPLEDNVDPAVQAERERYVAEHQRRANQSQLQASLKRSKRLWTEKLKVFIARYYDASPASIAEIKGVLGEIITDEKTKNEIGQVLGLLDSPM